MPKKKKPDVKVLSAVPQQEGVLFTFDQSFILDKGSEESNQWFITWAAIVDALFKASKK